MLAVKILLFWITNCQTPMDSRNIFSLIIFFCFPLYYETSNTSNTQIKFSLSSIFKWHILNAEEDRDSYNRTLRSELCKL